MSEAAPVPSPSAPPVPPAPGDPPAPARRRLVEAGAGTWSHAFASADWGMTAGTALIWGSSFLFIDIGLDAFRPGVVATARLLLGALTLALVAKARKPVAREDLGRIALLGVTWMALPLLLFPIAQQWIDSAVAGMINGAVPLTAAAWSVLLLRRLPGPTQLAGLAVGFAGIVAISWPELQLSRTTALGALLVLAAVTLYGFSVNIAVPLQQRYGSLPVLLRAQLVALVAVLPFGLWDLSASRWEWPSALAMLPLGVLSSGLAFVLMTTLVGRVGASRGSVAIYFVPIVAIVLGVLLRGETVAPLALVGCALVLGGAYLTSRQERPAAAHEAPR
jgi:drug/metabolite transporter (DMT)-like permease